MSKQRRVGLCERCRWMKQIESGRGSVFYLCRLSGEDARFPKYPPLPVLACPGFRENLEILPEDPDQDPRKS